MVYYMSHRGASINVWNRLAQDSEQVQRVGDDLCNACASPEAPSWQYETHSNADIALAQTESKAEVICMK